MTKVEIIFTYVMNVRLGRGAPGSASSEHINYMCL